MEPNRVESRAGRFWRKLRDFINRLGSTGPDRYAVDDIRDEYLRKYPELLFRF